jgi:hypothetical protein
MVVVNMIGCGRHYYSRYDLKTDTNKPDKTLSKAEHQPLLVVVRFPMNLSNRALFSYSRAYDKRGTGNYFYSQAKENLVWDCMNGYARFGDYGRNMNGAPQISLQKTAWLALSLYEQLAKVLPAGSIHLQPVTIDVKKSNKLEEGAVLWTDGWPDPFVERSSAEIPPAVLYVDVFSYVNPVYRSFGTAVTPMMSISTAPQISPKTGGALVTVQEFLPYHRQVALNAPSSRASGVRFSDYLSAVSGVPADQLTFPEDTLMDEMPVKANKLLVLPAKPIKPVESVLESWTSMVLSSLDAVDHNKATAPGMYEYIKSFDPALADRWRKGESNSKEDQKRIDMIKRFVTRELAYLDMLDTKFVKDVLHGPWAEAYQKQLKVEDEHMEQVIRAQNAQNLAAFSSGLQMTANQLSQMQTMGNMTATQQMQSNLSMMQQLMTFMSNQTQSQDELTKISLDFSNRLNGRVAEQTKFIVGEAGDRQEQARTITELRNKLKAYYRSVYPEI